MSPTCQQLSALLLVVPGFCWNPVSITLLFWVTNFRNLRTGFSKHIKYANKMSRWWGLLPHRTKCRLYSQSPKMIPDFKYVPSHTSKALGTSVTIGDKIGEFSVIKTTISRIGCGNPKVSTQCKHTRLVNIKQEFWETPSLWNTIYSWEAHAVLLSLLPGLLLEAYRAVSSATSKSWCLTSPCFQFRSSVSRGDMGYKKKYSHNVAYLPQNQTKYLSEVINI